MTDALVRPSVLHQALAQAETVPDFLRVGALAEATITLLKRAGADRAKQNEYAEVKLWAEYEAGVLLAQLERPDMGDRGQGRGGKIKSNVGLDLSEYRAVLDATNTTRQGANRLQQLRFIPKNELAEYIQAVMARDDELTTTGALRLAKEQKREGVRQVNRRLVEDTASPIEHVAGATYQTIALDPPWDWGDEGDVDQLGRARPVYDTMPIDEIAALPVPGLAQDNAHIYLWITNRSLPKGFALLEGWGFRYITAITWCKPHYGMGNYFRGSTEQVLFGVRGSLPLLRHDAGTWFAADRPGRHSGKPDEFYKLVETCSPGPWLEMFARQKRNGWASWGAEV